MFSGGRCGFSDGLLRYFTRKIRGFATSGRYAVRLQANGGTA